jgi:hypothetical protein
MKLRNIRPDSIKSFIDSIKSELVQDNHLTDDKLRNEYIKWLRSLTTKYHLTLTLRKGVTEKDAINSLKEFIHRINLKIYNKRYSRDWINSIKGVAVMEDTIEMETVHFHLMIINDLYLPSKDQFRDKISKAINSEALAIQEFHLQEYYRSEEYSLEKYLTKVFESGSLQDAKDRIAAFGIDGIYFGDGRQLSRFDGSAWKLPKKLSAR